MVIAEETNYLEQTLWGIYILVTAILLFRFTRNIITFYQLKKNNTTLSFQNATLVLLQEHVLPHTFMNKSGEAVVPMVNFYGIHNDELLIVHDELDLDVGRMRLKTGGGHGGHNGLRDIVPHIGADFHRLRLGIGHPGHKSKVSGYVLGKPTADEQIAFDSMLDAAMRTLPDLVTGDLAKAQQAINSFKLPHA